VRRPFPGPRSQRIDLHRASALKILQIDVLAHHLARAFDPPLDVNAEFHADVSAMLWVSSIMLRQGARWPDRCRSFQRCVVSALID